MPLNIELTEWQSMMLSEFFTESRVDLKNNKPGMVIAQIVDGQKPLMKVGYVGHDVAVKIQKAMGSENMPCPDGRAKKVDVYIPED